MTCRAIIYNPNNNKILKDFRISGNTYQDCEEQADKLRQKIEAKKYKDERQIKITHINI